MDADRRTLITADRISGNSHLLYKELSYKLRAVFFEVYNTLGPGFKEIIYHRAVAKELSLQRIPFESKKRLSISYKDERVGTYEPDFIIDGKILVEIKSLPKISKLDELQLFYYLKGTDYKLGFLVNFGGEKLDIKRRIYEKARKR